MLVQSLQFHFLEDVHDEPYVTRVAADIDQGTDVNKTIAFRYYRREISIDFL